MDQWAVSFRSEYVNRAGTRYFESGTHVPSKVEECWPVAGDPEHDGHPRLPCATNDASGYPDTGDKGTAIDASSTRRAGRGGFRLPGNWTRGSPGETGRRVLLRLRRTTCLQCRLFAMRTGGDDDVSALYCSPILIANSSSTLCWRSAMRRTALG